jgi:hypothetical protein
MPLQVRDGKQPALAITGTVAKECHARADTSARVSLPIANAVSRWSSVSRWYRQSALRLLLAEIGALGHRIRWVLQIREVELLRGTESVRKWMDEGLCRGSQSYKRGYIFYMQEIDSRYPFLSIFDRLLLARTWKAGSEWNALSGTPRNQECTFPQSCDQLSQVPDAGSDTSSHSRGHAQG